MIEIHFDGELVGYCTEATIHSERPEIGTYFGKPVIETADKVIDLSNVKGIK